MEIFEYAFMQKAFAAGLLLAAVIPCIGQVVVCKRLSMIGDALSHTSLAGVALGLILGFNPVLTAALACVLAALLVELIRRKLPRFAELSIAIMMSIGVGLAGILSGFAGNAANFSSFLFGSIVAVSQEELYGVGAVSLLVLICVVCLHRELFYLSLDEQAARLAGIPVSLINFIFTVLLAVTVSIAARTVGALIVSSMLVIPTACAMQFEKGYFATMGIAVCLDLCFMCIGLFAAFYLGLKPGGSIVLTGILFLLLELLLKGLIGKRGRKL